LLELSRRGAEVSYVKTIEGFEVDFFVRYPGGDQALIQVSATVDSKETRDREVRALLAAAVEHRRASLHLITLTPETARDIPGKITVHSAAEWLVEAGN